ncbi:MAG: FkbM family methyltransferase [Thermoproteus sp.]|nr:FkbM family methyltransferase [Thermoproteus sp.]MDT7882351.1 FkbM family methyltransferase [Thermoproteus sp.]
MRLFRMLRAFLKSNELFRNWFSAGVKYYLSTHGLADKYIKIKCSNGKEYRINRSSYSGIVGAYYNGLINDMECGDSIYLAINAGNHKLRLHVNSAVFIYDIVLENFVGGAYDDLDVGGRTVVDVGAGVGDTAILFSLRGARRVIALEPYPRLYGEASLNIRANGLADRVVLVNAGLGATDGEVCADLGDVEGYSVFRPGGRCDVKVRMYTLRTLIKEFEVEEGSALKMDCEGCEYEAVLNADPGDLAVFSQIVIEYHNGYREIKKCLEAAGFSTEIKPIRSAAIPIERQGYVVARRR